MSEDSLIARWGPTLAFLLVLPALIALGFWQLDRAEQKRSLQAEYDTQMNQAPIQIGAALKNPAELQYHRISISGFYDHSHTMYLDNRVHQGVPGYYVITPLKLVGSETRVLVNRGWVSQGSSRSNLPDVQPPRRLQQITGVATVPHAKVFRLAPARPLGKEWQQVWQHMDMKRFIEAVDYPVQPVVVLLDPASQAGGFIRQWRRLDTKVTMHQGYAFQWFSMAFVLTGIYLFYALWRKRKDENTGINQAYKIRHGIMNNQTQDQIQTRNRIKIIMVAAIFLAPVVVATVLKLSNWRPTQSGNYGELVQPARPLSALKFDVLKGGTVAIIDPGHQWLMVTFATGRCDESCESNIYKMRQIHIATGKHFKRIRRLLVLTSKPSSKLLKTLKAYPDMAVTAGPTKAVRDLGKQLYTSDGTALDGLNRIYFIDPIGNFMMTYDKNADPTKIRKDLGRLLRASRIG